MSCAPVPVAYGQAVYLYNPSTGQWVGNGEQPSAHYHCSGPSEFAQPISSTAANAEAFLVLDQNGSASATPGGPVLSAAGSKIGGQQAYGPVTLMNASRANMTSTDTSKNQFPFNCSD